MCGVHVGTQATRALCLGAIAWALFCVAWPLHSAMPAFFFGLIFAALFLGVAVAGWAPFQGMGLPPVAVPEQSWLRWLPLQLRLKVDTFWHDLVGMAEAGLVCMLPCFLVGFWFGHHAWLLLLTGIGFAPAYALARLSFPTIPNFASGQSWGEVFAGALVGAGLFTVFA